MTRFSDYGARVARTRVLIVGDVMLDRYWFGDVERISQEAPVPVVKVARTEERPGGAANVARNVAALGAQVTAQPYMSYSVLRASAVEGPYTAVAPGLTFNTTAGRFTDTTSGLATRFSRVVSP